MQNQVVGISMSPELPYMGNRLTQPYFQRLQSHFKCRIHGITSWIMTPQQKNLYTYYMIFSAYTREFCPQTASLRPSKMLIKCATPWKYEEEFFVLAPDHSQVFCKLLQCRAYLLNLFKLISSPKRLFKASNCFAILFKARQYYSRPVCKIMLSTNEISRDLGLRPVLVRYHLFTKAPTLWSHDLSILEAGDVHNTCHK